MHGKALQGSEAQEARHRQHKRKLREDPMQSFVAADVEEESRSQSSQRLITNGEREVGPDQSKIQVRKKS
jgi:hypothetical protein